MRQISRISVVGERPEVCIQIPGRNRENNFRGKIEVLTYVRNDMRAKLNLKAKFGFRIILVKLNGVNKDICVEDPRSQE